LLVDVVLKAELNFSDCSTFLSRFQFLSLLNGDTLISSIGWL